MRRRVAPLVSASGCKAKFAPAASKQALRGRPDRLELGEGAIVVCGQVSGDPVQLADAADERGVLDRPTAWVFGNEAWGIPAAERDLADAVVRVPIHGRAESLNLATAAAVCLYASARAHRRVSRSGARHP